jgi:hypothetical protein
MRLPGATEFHCRLSARLRAWKCSVPEYASERSPGRSAPGDWMRRKGLTRERRLFRKCLNHGTRYQVDERPRLIAWSASSGT